ncbi:MAG: hypothetical protein LBV41_07425 [Cytophagaceae bacterium]|jgi:hypothetical protein|nr:hypothetical protein [Cytophagaceae bacterium]
MEASVKLYSLAFNNVRTYLFATLFVAGNIILPQLCHLLPEGGLTLLPVYFFTLIAAYKYGIWAGLLTAVFSPLANSALFGMPAVALLPIILVKSALLAVSAALLAKRFGKISMFAILLAVLSYQFVGTLIEWAVVKNFFVAVQDFRIGIPGMLLQVFGGYLLLRAVSRI